MNSFKILVAISILFIIHSCKKDKPELAIVYTSSISEISHTTAISGGYIKSDGGAPITERGICWDTASNPTISKNKTVDGKDAGLFTSQLTNLTPNTIYYVAAYATNSAGISYGKPILFVTKNISSPELTTLKVTSLSDSFAIAGGDITSENGSPITERGICWGLTNTPTTSGNKIISGNGPGVFSCKMEGLGPNTPYFARAYAINTAGTGYGNVISFKTYARAKIIFNPAIVYSSVKDIENNTYKVVTIGTQTWMAENLRTTLFNDSTAIPLVPEGREWADLNTPAYSWYDDDELYYKNVYGALYNWYTVNTGKLCPSGWHVPSNTEWMTLINFLGGSTVAGNKLKETGTNHWNYPNSDATNESGFTALPGGGHSVYFITQDLADHYGECIDINTSGYWWTNVNGIYLNLGYNRANTIVTSGAAKGVGFSIRCVKN